MKRRLLAGGLALFFFFWLSLVFASNFGLIMSGQRTDCTLRLSGMLAALAADPRNIKLFLVLALGSVVLVLWMLFGSSYLNYKSNMYEVVPGFSIPRPEGRGSTVRRGGCLQRNLQPILRSLRPKKHCHCHRS